MIYTEDSSPQHLLKKNSYPCIKNIDLPSASSYIYDLSVFLLACFYAFILLVCYSRQIWSIHFWLSSLLDHPQNSPLPFVKLKLAAICPALKVWLLELWAGVKNFP